MYGKVEYLNLLLTEVNGWHGLSLAHIEVFFYYILESLKLFLLKGLSKQEHR